LKAMVDNYKKLDSTREDLLSELKRMAADMMDRVERARQSSKEFDPDRHLNTVKREAKKIIYPNYDVDKTSKQEVKIENGQGFEHHNAEMEIVPPRKTQKSFFDEIG
jgi:cell division initiation protein